mgnify:CR=1 FL=1
MALNDFTGQNIQDTYQKVVQTDGTNLADGTGSLLPISFDGNNVTISGSLTANEYIVSSSVTNITIATLSGSTEFGDTTDDTHTFIGNITASGNISSSGQIDADKIRTGGRIASSVFDIACVGSIDTDGTISSTGISNSSTYTGGGRIVLSGASSYIETPSYVSASSLISQTHITASGNISASGTSLITAQDLILDRQLTVPTIANVNTTHVTASGDISSSGDVSAARFIGDVTNTTGYRYPNLTNVPSGIISSSLQVFTNITASGNISSSGTITQANGLVAGAGRLYFSEFGGSNIYFIKAGNNLALANGGLTTSQITASGNISASGEIIGIINGGTF